MTQWDENLRRHRIWNAIGALDAKVESCVENEAVPDAEYDKLGRISEINAFVRARLESCNPSFVAQSTLDKLVSSFDQPHADLHEFSITGSVVHIENAARNAELALTYLGEIPTVSSVADLDSLAKAASKYHGAVVSRTEDLNGRFNAMSKVVDRLSSQLQALENSAESKLDSFQRQIVAEQSRIDAMIESFQRLFNEAQEKRQIRFDADSLSHDEKMKAQRADCESHFEVMEMRLDVNSSQIIKELESRKTEAQELLGIIGAVGMTSGFQKAAKQAWESAVSWQKYTAWAICGLIVFLLVSFGFGFGMAGLTWPELVGRILVSLAFGALATYCGFQADKYLRIQRINNKLELELAAVGPYLAPLGTEDQHKFLLELAKKVFGQDDVLLESLKSRSPTTIFDVLASKQVLRLLKALGPTLQAASPELAKLATEYVKANKSKNGESAPGPYS